MTDYWPEIDKAIKSGDHPFFTRVDESLPCLWQIRADPFSRAPFHDILVGRPCPSRTRWRFEASASSSVDSGAYCWPHLRRIADTEIEILRFKIHRVP
jgi:hypothetical protein